MEHGTFTYDRTRDSRGVEQLNSMCFFDRISREYKVVNKTRISARQTLNDMYHEFFYTVETTSLDDQYCYGHNGMTECSTS